MTRADEISQLVQPYLREAVRKGLEEATVVRPDKLLHPLRFDVCAKHIYARWREGKIGTDWGRNLYREHLLALNYGREIYPPKVGVEEFVRSYDSLLDSIGGGGEGRIARFDAARSVVPIDENGVLMDGAHRTAACMLFGIPLTIARINRAASSLPRSFDFSFDFFKTRGLPSNYLDFMSLEYARLSEDSYLAVIFPAASQIEQMENALRENCDVVCGKTIKVRGRFAAANIIRQIYPCESWIGNLSNGFEGAHEAAVYRFAGGDELKDYLQQQIRLLGAHPLVGEARGVGFLGAVELVADPTGQGRAGRVCRDVCAENGLIMRAVGDTMILCPPLIISRLQIDELVEKFRASLEQMSAQLRAHSN